MRNREISDSRRTAIIPLDYIIAEMIAFPLTSVSAFENRIISLDPEMPGPTAKLWRDAERRIAAVIPDLSIDQLVAIRDRIWFEDCPFCSSISIHDFLERGAAKFLETQGPEAIPRSVPQSETRYVEEGITNTSRRSRSLRWLSFSLPVDLLLGALGSHRAPPAKIRYLSPKLLTHLNDNGFAETHLHAWASLEFPVLWVTTLHALANSEINEKSFKSPGAVFDEGSHLASWLLRAAIARYLLALFLHETNIMHGGAGALSDYLERNILSEIGKSQGVTAEEAARRVIMELLGGKFLDPSPNYAHLRAIYREIAARVKIALPDDPDLLFFADPIAHLLPYKSKRDPAPEIQFIHRAISYLQDRGKKPDIFFETLFWQVVRIRGIFYRHVVQRPMTPGLQWFIRTYSRIKPGRKTVGWKLLLGIAKRTSGKNRGLRSLEIRTSPGTSYTDILETIRDFLKVLEKDGRAEAYSGVSRWDEFEFGIVFHFSKLRGGGASEGIPKARWMGAEADPRVYGPGGVRSRYSRYYRRKKNEAQAMARLLFNYPKSLKIIRGIDICTDELGVPSWVLVPVLRYVRDAGKAAARHLRYFLEDETPELRVTVHAGEDFNHLIGGLRRIEESVKYFKLRPGDRLGHAIALGTDPELWVKRKGHVAISREERLFDLAWEWTQYSHNGVPCSEGRLALIQREIFRLTALIFGEKGHITPYEMEKMVRCLHDEVILHQVGYPDLTAITFGEIMKKKDKHIEQDKHIDMLVRYLIDPDVFERGQVIEWVDTTYELDAMRSLQNYLRQDIASLGLVVEVNPTSNLLISNLADFTSHPLWRLNPPVKKEDVIPIAVCIGSDDPITFATNLRQEYALLHESLIAGGLSESQAYYWLEEARETGLSSRFTHLRVGDIVSESDSFSRARLHRCPISTSIYSMTGGIYTEPDNFHPDPLHLCEYHAVGLDRDISLMP